MKKYISIEEIWNEINLKNINSIKNSIDNLNLKGKIINLDDSLKYITDELSKYAYNYLMYKITKDNQYLYEYLNMHINEIDNIPYDPFIVINTLKSIKKDNILKYLMAKGYLNILYIIETELEYNKYKKKFMNLINKMIKNNYIESYKLLGDYYKNNNNNCLALYYYKKSNFYNLNIEQIDSIKNKCKKELIFYNIKINI